MNENRPKRNPDREKWVLPDEEKDGEVNFCEDGIVDTNGWISAEMKILYVLKEPNYPDASLGDDDMRQFLERGATIIDNSGNAYPAQTTWPMIAKWTHAILNGFPSWKTLENNPGNEFFLNPEQRRVLYRQVAVINLKKTGGGASTLKGSLKRHVRERRNELKEQIESIKPEIIICCGTGDEFWFDLYKGELVSPAAYSENGVCYTKHQTETWTVFEYYHPQARYPHNFLYTMLIDAIREFTQAR